MFCRVEIVLAGKTNLNTVFHASVTLKVIEMPRPALTKLTELSASSHRSANEGIKLRIVAGPQHQVLARLSCPTSSSRL